MFVIVVSCIGANGAIRSVGSRGEVMREVIVDSQSSAILVYLGPKAEDWDDIRGTSRELLLVPRPIIGEDWERREKDEQIAESFAALFRENMLLRSQLGKIRKSCQCNCHDQPSSRESMGLEEHEHCGICQQEMLKESEELSEQIEIEVCERANDFGVGYKPRLNEKYFDCVPTRRYHAQLKGHPEIWSAGDSSLEAIGSLICSAKLVPRIIVTDLGVQNR